MLRASYWFLFFTYSIFVFLFNPAQSQVPNPYSTSNEKAIELYREAILLEQKRNPLEALKKIETALKKDENFSEAWLKKGDLLNYMFRKEEAYPCWEKFLALSPQSKEAGSIAYLLGEKAFSEQNLEKARTYLKKFISLQSDKNTKWIKAEVMLASCGFIEKARKDSISISPKMLPQNINRYPLQYFPAITADEKFLLFTARRSPNESDDENLFVTKYINGKWQDPQSISNNINTRGNEGTGSISSDARVLVFTSCDYKESLGSCDLYITYRDGNTWSTPKNLTEVNSSSWESHPSLSADGQRLYFTSTRPGGEGGHDIWCAELDANGKWKEPFNLGFPINTPLDEMSPFIHANGTTLFFASNGHPGLGNFDIFSAEKESGKWLKPKNLGYPVNSERSELSLYITANGKRAFYSKEEEPDDDYSNRPMSRKPVFGKTSSILNSFLYEFEIPDALKIKNPCNYLTGQITEKGSGKKLAASVELIDLELQSTVYTMKSDAMYGTYTMVIAAGRKYGLFVNCPGYLYQSLTFDYAESPSLEPKVIDFELEPIKAGSMTVMNNIFFETGKHELLPLSVAELGKVLIFLKTNPQANIEIRGHTDDVGKDEDNQLLSQKRAQAVRDFLLKNKVAANRLKAIGYGEKVPLKENSNADNRAMNRRIEFKIL